MLTILRDPCGITGRQQFPLDCALTLQQNIEQHLPAGGGCKLSINGIEVHDPGADPRLDARPCASDAITVVQRPEGLDPVTWYYIALAVFTVYIYASLPKAPNNAGSTPGKDSPNNRLTAQTNIARTYQARPDVYGNRRLWPDLIQPSTIEYIDHVKYVTEWLDVSRGKGDISAVRYANTPIEDIEGASFTVFEPVAAGGYVENGTTTLTNVTEAFETPDVNGQEMIAPLLFPVVERTGLVNAEVAATSFTVKVSDAPDLDELKSRVPAGTAIVSFDAGKVIFSAECTVLASVTSAGDTTFTFSSEAWGEALVDESALVSMRPSGTIPQPVGPFTLPVMSDRLRWNTVFLRGLKGTVQIKAEWWKVDEAGAEIGGTRQDTTSTYTADTYDQRYFTTEVTPSAGPGMYRMEFVRVSAENGDGSADVAKLEEVYAVRFYATKVLPGDTIIRITTKATAEATGFSDRKFNLQWQRHVRTLTGEAVGPSRNFARAMAHVWSLAGEDIAELDTDKLATINAALGEDSPLLRFDCSLDDADMSLGDRLQLIANHARCTLWRDGNRWTVTRDQLREYPEAQLDYRNLAARGDSSLTYSAHLPATNDGIEVEYVNPDTQATKAYARISIASGAPVVGNSANPRKLQLQGCVTEAQALNRAHLEARRLLYQRMAVNDTALGDAGTLGVGALIRWIDPEDFAGDDGLQAGEVTAIAGLVIRTSEPLDWKGEASGRVMFTGLDGRRLGAPVQCVPDGAGLRLLTPVSGLYVADAARQCGSRYAFAVGLTEAEIEAAGRYVVTEVNPSSSGSVSIAFANYDERLYEED